MALSENKMSFRTPGFLLWALLMVPLPGCVLSWDNGWDGTLTKECPTGQAFYAVKSEHSNYYEDRRYEWKCKSFDKLSSANGAPSCSWKNDVNSYDRDMNFACPDGSVVTGAKSTHSNYYEDRRWSFKCCSPGNRFKSCVARGKSTSGYINNMDGGMNWSTGKNMIGFYSTHSNYYEDRRWKVTTGDLDCSDVCQCSGTIDSDWTLNKINYDLDRKVIRDVGDISLAQQTFDNDSGSSEITATFSVSKTISDTSSYSHEAGVSITVGTSFSAGIPGLGEATASLEVTGSYAHTWGREKSISKQVTSSYTVTVAPKSHVKASGIMTKSNIDVPYTMTYTHKNSGCSCTSSGMWHGVQGHNLLIKTEDIPRGMTTGALHTDEPDSVRVLRR